MTREHKVCTAIVREEWPCACQRWQGPHLRGATGRRRWNRPSLPPARRGAFLFAARYGGKCLGRPVPRAGVGVDDLALVDPVAGLRRVAPPARTHARHDHDHHTHMWPTWVMSIDSTSAPGGGGNVVPPRKSRRRRHPLLRRRRHCYCGGGSGVGGTQCRSHARTHMPASPGPPTQTRAGEPIQFTCWSMGSTVWVEDSPCHLWGLCAPSCSRRSSWSCCRAGRAATHPMT